MTSSEIQQHLDSLADPSAYPGISAESVERLETHISWIFLVGQYAFKVKKPVRTEFLDYSTPELRKHFCEEEVRLDARYAGDLYLGVVPICIAEGSPVVDGEGAAIEYAVKMRRFPVGSLLSERMESDRLTSGEVFELADCIADFHDSATRVPCHDKQCEYASVESVLRNATDNLDHLRGVIEGPEAHTLRILTEWTDAYFGRHRRMFAQRATNGFIRECHGDLHLENIVYWNGRLIPFDGIEFNDAFRWIDVLSDAAFTAMDFAARGRLDLSRSFVNAYLERTGDHASLALLRWYLVYRALTRAKVASIRYQQSGESEALEDCHAHIELAYRFSLVDDPFVWITRGVSGSGKTTVSEAVVQQKGAIRLRSDIERKRHFGLCATERPSESQVADLYSDSANRATYNRLQRMAKCILRSGYPVVVDATFLKRHDRDAFRRLAENESAEFGILDCNADLQTLRQRIVDRLERGTDASDADVSVLQKQLAAIEPLGEDELACVMTISDTSGQITHAN